MATEGEDLKPPDPSSFGVYYARLAHQQNMLQDAVRTETYRRAIVGNVGDFEGKVVLDVGSGTGILAFFAAQAGAGRIYAVEASAMASKALRLVASRGNAHVVRWNQEKDGDPPKVFDGKEWNRIDENFRIHVVQSKVEDAELPEKVDVIVSEPLGFLLVHERMLEAFVTARDHFLKPTGKMMPSNAVIKVLPIADQNLWNEQVTKASFWTSRNFYGVDLTDLYTDALEEYFSQAVVGYFSFESCLAQEPSQQFFDFSTITISELRNFTIPLNFPITKTAVCHGIGCWFDAHFIGSDNVTTLSTGPNHPGTHWYQCRLLLEHPIAVNAGQRLTGDIRFTANTHLSYDLHIQLHLQGTDISSSQKIRLDDQMYHYLQVGGTNPVPTAVGQASSLGSAGGPFAVSDLASSPSQDHLANVL